MPRLGLGMRWWLALAFAAIAALTAVLVTAVSSRQAENAVGANAQDIAVGKTVSAAFVVQKAVSRGNLPDVLELVSTRRQLALFVFDDGGAAVTPPRSMGVPWRAIPRHAAALRAALAGHRFVAAADDGKATVVALPLHRTAAAGALVAFAPRPIAYARSLSIFHREVARAALWAVLVAACAGLLAAALIAARLRRIGAAARAIEQGDFEARLAPRFRDEVGVLAATIDRMRERLADSFAALTAERDRLGRVLERLHEGVVTVDPAGRVEFANATARRLLGREAIEEGFERHEPWTEFPLAPFVRRLFRPDACVAEARIALADGLSYALVGIPPARPEGGETAVLVLTDVTERERRERAEREFVANAAHELRTPLTTITGAVEMLDAGAKDVPEERDRFLDHIRAEALRLGRLTRALLVLARAQTREEAPRLAVVELQPLLEEVIAGLQAPEAVALDLECPAGLVALTERDLLGQVVSNLAANAIKHTTSGSVRVSARVLGRSVRLEVRDTGDGMPSAVRERVFDRFYRAGDRDEDGFGLGLAIVREAVRALGGVVDVDTAPGAGTTVRVTLPAAEARAA